MGEAIVRRAWALKIVSEMTQILEIATRDRLRKFVINEAS